MRQVIGSSTIVLAAFILIPLAIAGELPVKSENNPEQKNFDKDTTGPALDCNDLDRLSDLLLHWDRLRQTDNRAGIADIQRDILSELRPEPEGDPAGVTQVENDCRKSLESKDNDRDSQADQRFQQAQNDPQVPNKGVKAREDAENIMERKREIARELIYMQRKIDKGSDKFVLLREKQNELLQEYLLLSMEEIELGYREVREDWQAR